MKEEKIAAPSFPRRSRAKNGWGKPRKRPGGIAALCRGGDDAGRYTIGGGQEPRRIGGDAMKWDEGDEWVGQTKEEARRHSSAMSRRR